MVHHLITLYCLTTASAQADTRIGNAEAFVPDIKPFLQRAERGILETTTYPLLDFSTVYGSKVGDLVNTYRLRVGNTVVEWDANARLVRFASFGETTESRISEPPYDESLQMAPSRIEPLVNEYARAAGYPYALKVTRSRLSMNVPIHYEVSVIPVHQGIPFSWSSSGRFEVDYRHGRLISMNLYGAPKAPQDLTPHLNREQARIAMLQALFGRYGMPGVEEPKPAELVIAGFPEEVENDDAVKWSQRVWNVQGKLVYETGFDHIERWGAQGTPMRKYRVMIDANTGEIISLFALAPGGGISHAATREVNFPTEGRATVAFGKRSKVVDRFKITSTSRIIPKSTIRIVLTASKLAAQAKYDPKSGLLGIGTGTYIPNSEMAKALRELTRQ